MNLIETFNEKTILVIGDIMLDTYYTGEVNRISPEAPVPVFKKKTERYVPGGAANVAVNLAAAKQKVAVMSVIGNDNIGKKLIEIMEKLKIDTNLIEVYDGVTSEKVRFIALNNQQIMRLDIEDVSEISDELSLKLVEHIKYVIKDFDLIVISDYLKGLLRYDLIQCIIEIAKDLKIPTLVDVKDSKIEKYKNAFLLKPNLKELGLLTGKQPVTDDEIVEVSEELRNKCSCEYVLTTCGARGMVLVGNNEKYIIKATAKEVFDVTGAGDTTIAYLAACLANGIDIKSAVNVSNYAAGLQVAKAGTSPVYLDEVKNSLLGERKNSVHKLLRDNIDKIRERFYNKKIVFTNGCFDILHIGHVKYLEQASRLGDILIVGLNSDNSVKRIKGEDRPINNENSRAEMLSALECVNYVVIFDEDTPYDLIGMIKPDILVKGGDYTEDEVIGKDIVEKKGGYVKIIPYVDNISTTILINKIRDDKSE